MIAILAAMASSGFRVLASAGAALSLAAALGWDFGGAEHPTHTLGLAHLLVTDGAAVGVQIVLSCPTAGAAAVLAATTGLLGSVLHPVLLLVTTRVDRADEPTPLPRTPDAGAGRQRRMARVTRALRRGPPVPLPR